MEKFKTSTQKYCNVITFFVITKPIVSTLLYASILTAKSAFNSIFSVAFATFL